MKFNIIIETDNKDSIYNFVEQVHNSLKGNTDYIYSDVLLHHDESNLNQECTLHVYADCCTETDKMIAKTKESIDLFMKYNKKGDK